jgi:hypothetical protein
MNVAYNWGVPLLAFDYSLLGTDGINQAYKINGQIDDTDY